MFKTTYRNVIVSALFSALSVCALAQNPPTPETVVAPEAEVPEAAPEIIPTVMRRVRTDGASDQIFYAPAGTERMRIDSDTGYVGIGTGIGPGADLNVRANANRAAMTVVENPNVGTSALALLRASSDTAMLSVSSHGSGRISTMRFGAVLGGWSEILNHAGNGLIIGTLYATPLTFGTNNVNRLHIAADGKVGIGTSTPSGQLHVYADANKDVYAGFGTHVVDGPSLNIGMAGQSFGRSAGFINVRPDALATGVNPSFRVLVADVPRMIITNAGRVGIGNLAPAEVLDVTGNIRATGDIHADGVIHVRYQDLAEWVPATEDLPPGTVVVLNPDRDNEVMPSGRAYDTTVAGVVSAQPGLVLGEASANKETVATTGRVRVRVDARRAPIAIGDLLVTSGVPGMAMKSTPIDMNGIAIHRPGTIIGKALQPLAGGEGEILVLLSLQ